MKPVWWKWLGCAVGVSLAGFLGMFAADVFSEGYSGVELLIALFMHLFPSLLVALGVALGLRWPGVGGVLLVGLGCAAAWFYRGFQGNPFALILAGWAVLAGVFYLLAAAGGGRKGAGEGRVVPA